MLIWLVGSVGLLIGAVSVIRAVYIDKRELTCAYAGGGSNAPLGLISPTENGHACDADLDAGTAIYDVTR